MLRVCSLSIRLSTINSSCIFQSPKLQIANKLGLALWLFFFLPIISLAQICDSNSRPCIKQTTVGDVNITGMLNTDPKTHRVPDGSTVDIKVNGLSIGSPEWNPDGYFSKNLATGLPAASHIELIQLPATSGGTATAFVVAPTQSTNSLMQNYIALQHVRGVQAPQTGEKDTAGKGLRKTAVECPAPTPPPDAKVAAAADGTYSPFGAVFDILASFTDAGNGAYPSAQSSIQTALLGKVEWESEHYGYHNTACGSVIGFERAPDFSFGGSIGIYPSLVLENLTSNTLTIAQPNARPMFQDAFRWSIGPRVNYPIFSHGEIGAFANFGQTFLIDQVTSFKDGDDTVVATPVSNNVGRAAGFIEGGVQAKILSSPIWVAHDNKYDNMRPLFVIAGGVRKDWRFSRSGDLGDYNHPRDRVFFQFFVNLMEIKGFTDEIKKQAPASVRFGIDLERGMLDQRIPTATRYYVSADLNIMSIFKPSKPETPTPPPTQ